MLTLGEAVGGGVGGGNCCRSSSFGQERTLMFDRRIGMSGGIDSSIGSRLILGISV